ncbi:MAG: PDZ domain-containing protein [Planctomycetes bacterium]|nr:PDZ domain-containing protein [Planctomycetota bacterium]
MSTSRVVPRLAVLAGAVLCFASPHARAGDDPAPLRLALLQKMDAQIHARAARAHIEARLLLDETMPIAFLGMVAEDDGGAAPRVTQIYRGSGAAGVGLAVDDRILALGGVPTPTKQALYRTIRTFQPAETVDLRILRDGQEQVLHPVLGRRWEEDEEDAEQYADIPLPAFSSRGLPTTLDFDLEADGAPPAGITQALGGVGRDPAWIVRRDGERGVLRQGAPDTIGLHFPMALAEGVDADDVVARVRFRLVEGAQDRCAGIMLHWQGPDDYIVARANAVEGDLRIFRTVDGLRRTLPGAVAQVSIDDDAWHTLEFRVEGPLFTAVLDDSVQVSGYDTFFAHGGVGLWTKADAVTDFDGFEMSAPVP